MTRKLLFFSSFIAFVFSINCFSAQEVDQKIIDAFGDEYVDNLVKTNVNHLNYLNCFLANSYEIVKISADIDDKFPLASSFLKKLKHQKENNYLPDLDDFNVLMYNFPRDRKLKKSYRIDKTDYVIVFFSENEFVEIFNNYVKNI